MRWKPEVKNFNKKLIFTIFLALIALAVIIPLTVFLIQKNRENATVAKVNGETISSREFKQALIDRSASIYSYFKQKYNADDSENFWTQSFSGEIPIKKARKEALELVTRIKVQQMLAKEKGLLDYTSYQSFLKLLEKENSERKEAVSKGQVIYGPQQYGESEFFNYMFSNTLIKLKEKLEEKELAVSEQEMKAYYNANRDKSFKREEEIKIQKIILSFVDDKDKTASSKRLEAEAKVKEIKSRLDRGEKLEDVVKAFAYGTVKVKLEEQIFDESSVMVDSEQLAQLREEAEKLDTGKISDIMDGGNSFIVFKVTEKKAMGYLPFEEVKDAIKPYIVDKKYDEMVEKLVKDAKVDINPMKYNSVWVR